MMTKEDIKSGKHLPVLQTVFVILGIIYFIVAIYLFSLQVRQHKNG